MRCLRDFITPLVLTVSRIFGENTSKISAGGGILGKKNRSEYCTYHHNIYRGLQLQGEC